MSKLIDLIRVGRWLLCRFFSSFRIEKETSAATVPAREHVVDRGEARLVLLSTQPVILRPSYSELLAPVRDLPPSELEDAIQKFDLVKTVFPVDLYLNQLESIHGLSECVQSGTSSISLALELTGHSKPNVVTNDFVVHFYRKSAADKRGFIRG